MTYTVWLDEEKNALGYIDQTKLPNELVFGYCDNIFDLVEVIKRLSVRGAPAIGVGAAIGLYAAASRFEEDTVEGFVYSLKKCASLLKSARPTAVNLMWATDRMVEAAIKLENCGVEAMKKALKREALAIFNEDIETCLSIGRYGETLLKDGDSVLTHCNAGRLAAVCYGTALAPIYVASENGKKIKVYADETRPLLQGARLTAYELAESGIDVTLQCDNMAASLMSKGLIDCIFVGADRVAKNGDTANKIGTSGLAIIAKYYGVPFYVCAPFSTIDFNCESGKDIEIEQRNPDEVTTMHYKNRMTHKDVKVYNPAFDVTPNELIAGIITERGIFCCDELKNQK